jgi:hypothetical protein
MTTTAVVVPASPATTDDPVVTARRLSRVGIAALLASTRAAREAVGADDPAGRTADIGLGSVALARETTLAAARSATETGARVASGAATRLDPVVRGLERLPGLGSLVAAGRTGVGSTLDALAEAGRAERQQASSTGMTAVHRTLGTLGPETIDLLLPVVVDRIAADPDLLAPVVTQVIDRLAEEPDAVGPLVDGALARLAHNPQQIMNLIDAIIEPVVAVAIPAALNRLTDDPSQIRSLVWDQSGGLADEMANSFRARLVSADDAINAITDRLSGRTRRRRRAERRAARAAAGAAATAGTGAAPGAAPTAGDDNGGGAS